MQNIVVQALATPLLIGIASLVGRRWGHHVAGWLIGLPLTSGPVALFLTINHGVAFAGQASVGMLAGTISQMGFALAYCATADRWWLPPLCFASLTFALITFGLSYLHWSALPTFALVSVALVASYRLTRRIVPANATTSDVKTPPWDIPVRVVAGTTIVLIIIALAPIVGPNIAGLLTPFPVFGAVLTVFAHRTHGRGAATATLRGFVAGLAIPTMFFVTLAFTLRTLGVIAFAIATGVALIAQAITILTILGNETLKDLDVKW